MPALEISPDSGFYLGEWIKETEQQCINNGFGYRVVPYITEERACRLGYSSESGTCGIIVAIKGHATYLTESGKIIIVEEWTYDYSAIDCDDNANDDFGKGIVVYRRKVGLDAEDAVCSCEILEEYFSQFEEAWDNV